MIKAYEISTFFKAYIKSMRLYYSFITGIAGLVGFAYYQYLLSNNINSNLTQLTSLKVVIIMSILFLSWGINQIYNDYLGLEEDKINAPDRPMVSGELNPKYALILSTFLMFVALCITWIYLEVYAIIALIFGVSLNIIYEFAKAYGIWGNTIFGIMISSCTMYSFLASGNSFSLFWSFENIFIIIYIALINGLMTFYTYFKDFEGDKAAGKKTLIVKLGLKKSSILSLILSFIPLTSFLIFYYAFQVWDFHLNGIFLLLGVISTTLQLWTGYLYYKNPSGEQTYFSLSMNFRACTCTESAFISIFNPALGVILFLASYFFIGLLFNFHSNSKG